MPSPPASAAARGEEAVVGHLTRVLGEPTHVLHAVATPGPRIHVHAIPPSQARRAWTLFTTGMSDQAMTVPPGSEPHAHAELMISLPPDWPMHRLPGVPTGESEERWSWPITWLRLLARFPHEQRTWFGSAHSLPNGHPARPLGPGTEMCGFLFLPPVSLPTEARTVKDAMGRVIHLLALVPLHQNELDLLEASGTGPLFDGFEAAWITDLVDPSRPSVLARRPVAPPSVPASPPAAAPPAASPPGQGSFSWLETGRIACLVTKMLGELGPSLAPGLRTKDIEERAVELLRKAGLRSKHLGFRGFPSALAISIDDEVVHGLPSDRRLESGQLVKIQLGGRTDRGAADQGWTFAVGPLSEEKARLREGTLRALHAALAMLRPGVRTGDLGATIQATLEAAGLHAIRDYGGYRIGERPMEAPSLPCHGVRGEGARLTDGMVLHVQAIAAAGSHELTTRPDRWTVATQDGRPAALFTAIVRLHAAGSSLLAPLPA